MKSRKIWKTVLIVLGCALGAWAFGALLLPVLLPFFIGLAVSLLAEKPVRLLQTRAHVPRSLASGLCVLLLFGLLFGGLFFLCRLLCAEAADLARQLPQLAENLAPLFEKLITPSEHLTVHTSIVAKFSPEDLSKSEELISSSEVSTFIPASEKSLKSSAVAVLSLAAAEPVPMPSLIAITVSPKEFSHIV